MLINPALLIWSIALAYVSLGIVIALCAKMLQHALEHLEQTLRPTLESLAQMRQILEYIETIHRLEHGDFDAEDDGSN